VEYRYRRMNRRAAAASNAKPDGLTFSATTSAGAPARSFLAGSHKHDIGQAVTPLYGSSGQLRPDLHPEFGRRIIHPGEKLYSMLELREAEEHRRRIVWPRHGDSGEAEEPPSA
jgi:hypothetical protein